MSAPTIDFLHPHRPAWLGWGLLAMGVATLAASLGLQHRWADQRADREAAIAVRAEAAERARREALKPVAPSPDERRFQHITPQLRQPWLPTLRLIENATEPPVYLLALSIDPGAGSLHIEGEAPTFDQVLSYVQTLDEPGLLGPAELRSHELVTDATGRTTVHFNIVTRWIVR
jgi:hypothetical protein